MDSVEATNQVIDAYLRRVGIDPEKIRGRIGRPSVLRDNFDEVGRMYRAGYTSVKIAKRFGVAPSTVRSFLLRNPDLKT